jgi:hypothetical protein
MQGKGGKQDGQRTGIKTGGRRERAAGKERKNCLNVKERKEGKGKGNWFES